MSKIEIITIAVLAIFAASDGFSDAYMFMDRPKAVDPAANRAWHRWQFIRQGSFIAFAAYCAASWPMLLLGASVFWILQDGIVNRVGLGKPFFYMGTTATIDKFFRRFKNYELANAIAKFASLAIGILLTIKF